MDWNCSSPSPVPPGTLLDLCFSISQATCPRPLASVRVLSYHKSYRNHISATSSWICSFYSSRNGFHFSCLKEFCFFPKSLNSDRNRLLADLRQMETSFCLRKEEANLTNNGWGVCVCVCMYLLCFTIAHLNSENNALFQKESSRWSNVSISLHRN